MSRKILNISVSRHTQNGGSLKSPVQVFTGDAEFSHTFRFCYLPEFTIEKIKGGCGRGNSGSHIGVEDGEIYTIHKFKS